MKSIIYLLKQFKKFIETGMEYKLPIGIFLSAISLILYERYYLNIFIVLYWIFTACWLLCALWLVINGWINTFVKKD